MLLRWQPGCEQGTQSRESHSTWASQTNLQTEGSAAKHKLGKAAVHQATCVQAEITQGKVVAGKESLQHSNVGGMAI